MKVLRNKVKSITEESFFCKRCKTEIGGHNKFLHDGMCDDCFFEDYFP